MKNVTLKVEQNGGEYYGLVSIRNVPNELEVVKKEKALFLGDIAIEFDEYIEIIKIN